MKKSLACLVVALGLSTAASASPFYDGFEDWAATSGDWTAFGNGADVVATWDGQAAQEGTSQAAFDDLYGWNGITHAFAAADGYTEVSGYMNIGNTAMAAMWADAGGTAFYVGANGALAGNKLAYRIGSTWYASSVDINFDTWEQVTFSLTATDVSATYAGEEVFSRTFADLGLTPAPTYFEGVALGLPGAGGTASQTSFDNIAAVPEPACAALMLAGALCLVRRRH